MQYKYTNEEQTCVRVTKEDGGFIFVPKGNPAWDELGIEQAKLNNQIEQADTFKAA